MGTKHGHQQLERRRRRSRATKTTRRTTVTTIIRTRIRRNTPKIANTEHKAGIRTRAMLATHRKR